MSKKCVLFLRVSTVKQDYNQQIGRLKSAAAEYGYTNDEDFIIIGANWTASRQRHSYSKII